MNSASGGKKSATSFFSLIAQRVTAVLISFVLIALVLELVFRFYSPFGHIFAGISVDEPWRIIRHLSGDELAYDLHPDMDGLYSTNSLGLRDRQDDLEEGLHRVFVLGDSITFGHRIDRLEDLWVQVAERILQSKNSQIRLLNLGVIGYNTVQEVERFERVSRVIDAKTALLAWYVNDEDDTPVILRQGDRLVKLQHGEIAKTVVKGRTGLWLAGRSALYRTAAWALFKRGMKTGRDFEDGYDMLRRQAFHSSVLRMDEICRKRGIRPLMVLIPDITTMGPDYPWKEHHLRASRIAEGLGWKVFDLYEQLFPLRNEPLTFMPGDNHPNVEGHRIIGGLIADFLSRAALAGP